MSAAAMMASAFLTGKVNSSAEWEMDSNPTNAQGPIARMVKMPVRGFFPGANPGDRNVFPASGLDSTAAAQMRTPPHSSTAITICRNSAALARIHKNPVMAIAPTERRSSPK